MSESWENFCTEEGEGESLMAWGVGEEGEATVPDGGEEGKGGVVEDASVEADMW